MAVVWAIAGGLAGWNHAGLGGAVGCALGAGIGVVLEDRWRNSRAALLGRLSEISGRPASAQWGLRFTTIVLLISPLLVGVLAAWGLGMVGLLGLRWSFLLADIAWLAGLSASAVLGVRLVVDQRPLLRPTEWLIMGVLMSSFVQAHRGTLDRPYWLSDWFGLEGIAMEHVLLAIGLFFVPLLVAHGIGVRLAAGGSLPRPKVWLGLLAFAALALAVFFRLPPLRFDEPAAPQPPVSFSSDPPPPPPPEPETLAMVELLPDGYYPKKLKGYYFRERVLGTCDGFGLKAAVSPEPGELAQFPEHGEDLLPPPASQVGVPLPLPLPVPNPVGVRSPVTPLVVSALPIAKVRLNLLRDQPRPWLLAGSERIELVAPADSSLHFVRAYEVSGRFPGADGSRWLEAGSLEKLRAFVFVPQEWLPAEIVRNTRTSNDPRLSDLLAKVLAPLQLEWPGGAISSSLQRIRRSIEATGGAAAEIPAARFFAVVGWLETNVILDDEVVEEPTSLQMEQFLFGSESRGSSTYVATAGCLLLRQAGIPSRVAKGYLVPLDKQSADRFSITDQHEATWLEVHLVGGGWIPVPINPLHVIARKQPPPVKEKEAALLNRMDSAKKSIDQSKSPHPWALRMRILVPLVAAFLIVGLLVCFGRWLRGYWPRYVSIGKNQRRGGELHRVYLGRAAELLSALGFTREFGETWSDFARRLGSGDESGTNAPLPRIVAARFGRIVEMNSQADAMSPDARGGLSVEWGIVWCRFHRAIFFRALIWRGRLWLLPLAKSSTGKQQ